MVMVAHGRPASSSRLLLTCFVWLVGTYSLILSTCLSEVEALSPDGLALLDFKRHITRDPDGHLNNWNERDASPCKWTGVTCVSIPATGGDASESSSAVSGLDLTSKSLKGTVPASLGSLSKLTKLDLSWNRLSGTIPDEIVNCKLLTRLDLTANYFLNGSIPANISQLRSLEYLSLSANSLQGIVPGILCSSVSNLTTLSLSWNKLSGAILHEIVDCKLLRVLYLRSNRFTGSLPANISQLRSLKVLDVSSNSLEGTVPASLGSLSNLTLLDLSGNKLSGTVPDEIVNCKLLTWLRLGGNLLTGSIPTNISQLWSLEVLYLRNNSLSGTIPSLDGLTSLTELDLSFNHLGGTIPALDGLTSLTELDLSFNHLGGDIPPGISWGDLPNIRRIDLSSNRLTGTIPVDILQIPSYANLSGNFLTGTIPNLVDMSPNTRDLDLSNNELDGAIPSWIGSSRFSKLALHNNNLSGDITSLWSNASSQSFMPLRDLQLQGNRLSGHIGQATCSSWGNLQSLDLSSNIDVILVNDSLQLMLATFSKLEVLRLSNMSGRLPPRTFTTSSRTIDSRLRVLDLSHSSLEGELSLSYFVDAHFLLPNLESLNLSRNLLTGQVPPSLALLRYLTALDLSYNLLSGPLPPFPPSLFNPAFFAGNPGLCGPPLPPCKRHPRNLLTLKLVAALIACVLVSGSSCVLFAWRLRAYSIRHQQDAELIAAMQGRNSANLMPLADLRKATANFSGKSQIGVGGFGTVYKGKLRDGTTVAIKRSKRQASQQDKDQFLNEVNILSHVNHRNLVRLLGCCLEKKIALLVFEYVSSGTLQEHLHVAEGACTTPLSWGQRLRIAFQIADALAYLHSAANPPIFHRDVKSANILLDDDMNAKVADFGISKLVPLDATHVSTVAQGTLGYIDPDYYISFQLSAKSDVYSFGVVLLELISAQAPVDIRRGPEDASLARLAVPLICSGRLQDIVDPTMADAFNSTAGNDSIVGVATLAVKCLEPKPRDRPSMLELKTELRDLWHQFDPTSADIPNQAASSNSGIMVSDFDEHDGVAFLSNPCLQQSSSVGTSGSQIQLASVGSLASIGR